MWYKTFLPRLHELVRPKIYVEIGIRHGYSLSLSPQAKKIAIDPKYAEKDMQFEVCNADFYQMTSDDFFSRYSVKDIFKNSFDLGYIDGLHLFEYALRDFINLEASAGPHSILIVDDVIPRASDEASRKATGGPWAGDVWKMIDCLKTYRPDVFEHSILAGSEPTGCLICPKLDPENTTLKDNYEEILERFLSDDYPKMIGEELLSYKVDPEIALS